MKSPNKVAASLKLDQDMFDRVVKLSEEDSRTVSSVLEMCVKDALPVLEAEVKAKKAARAAMKR